MLVVVITAAVVVVIYAFTDYWVNGGVAGGISGGVAVALYPVVFRARTTDAANR